MRHILITGVPGIGKTTLIQNIIKKLKDIDVELDGFYTQEYRNERNQRLGFEIVVIQNNKRGILADKSNAASTNDVRKLGQYTVYVKNFEELVFPIISTFNKKLLVIDEIGKMELFSKKFEHIIGVAFTSNKFLIVATVPAKGPPFVEKLKRNTSNQLFTVYENNREGLANDILSTVKAELRL
ncbi:nucleoside-triphosphatase THEP1 isoform X1 [Rhynchophorus ferrugineus]|uniref:Uncharacterized protein n=1 Tax=Rhynchophorus ferrugineus TaxID=354439 RepID=A0A834IYR7_RHYFE|nr:hypothetical protein GWI33_006057 [Rhynchophorus ferrugineus]